MVLALQVGSKADSFHRAAASGRYHLNSPYATAFNVNATSSFFSSTGLTTTSGTVSITSNVIVIYAGVSKLTTDTVSIGGVTYKHATVTSKSFSFQGQPAHAVVETIQATTYGMVGFQIVADSGAILTASWPAGFYQVLPLEYGGVTIL
jgi:hypothetical protein